MNNGNTPDDISLKLLDELQREPVITQRALAASLGIALGLVNAYVRRLYKKGYIKSKNLSRKRIKYIITPKGFTEKARLTYNYMHRSINYISRVREKIEKTYTLMLGDGVMNILLWGDGEIAELCYISTRGLPVKIVGIVSNKKDAVDFFGYHVYSKDDAKDIHYDAVLVASLEDKAIKVLEYTNINPDRIYYL